MSDNSASRQSSSDKNVSHHIRLSYPPKKTELLGDCLRRAFDDDKLPEEENDNLYRLLGLLD